MQKSLNSELHTNLNTSSGKLPYKLTNDYLFRAVFQSRPKALEGLCRSVLHLSAEDTVSVTLQNPIELGQTIDSKEFILDLAVLVNNALYLNLEMQVLKEAFWPERALSYACRSFDQLIHGENYGNVLPVVHIGFLDFKLFNEYPEFYATYQFVNVKNQHVFSDKLRISVVNLNQTELATEDDKKYGIDLWARVFKATTWEEIEMLAQKNEYLQETVSGVRQLTEEEKIRQQCQAREDYYFWERVKNYRQEKALAERDEIILQKDKALQQKDEALQQKDEALHSMEDELARLRAELAALKQTSI